MVPGQVGVQLTERGGGPQSLTHRKAVCRRLICCQDLGEGLGRRRRAVHQGPPQLRQGLQQRLAHARVGCPGACKDKGQLTAQGRLTIVNPGAGRRALHDVPPGQGAPLVELLRTPGEDHHPAGAMDALDTLFQRGQELRLVPGRVAMQAAGAGG